ncbi:ribonuclease H protein [Rutstroemia sp. NJR-2017a BBW]|nr:ribonuclease H protein [Rutstroemia sp. NJR-2017a BBW]
MPAITRKRKHSGDGEEEEGGKVQRKEEVKEKKFYAVRKGFKAGVFESWKDCQEQTTGFKGALYKSFTNKPDAEAFVAGKNPAKTNAEPKFYGIAVGKKTGVYTEWADAQKQIAGVKAPKYKKFATREEAQAFVDSGGKVEKDGEKGEVKEKGAKRQKVEREEEEEEEEEKEEVQADTVRVWTDGSSRGNGRLGAKAGVGVWFGEDDKRNLSEPLAGLPQTNQRAELTAALRALEIVPRNKHIEIITDSNYTINCATVWYKSWVKNGWKTSTGKNVENKDLVVKIREILDQREGRGVRSKMTWVKGHEADEGNVAADRLAVAGALGVRQ